MDGLIHWWKKFKAAIRLFWSAEAKLAELQSRCDAYRDQFDAGEAALDRLRQKCGDVELAVGQVAYMLGEMRESSAKQLADLRNVVNNLREEAKQGTRSARNASELRRFVATTGEGE